MRQGTSGLIDPVNHWPMTSTNVLPQLPRVSTKIYIRVSIGVLIDEKKRTPWIRIAESKLGEYHEMNCFHIELSLFGKSR